MIKHISVIQMNDTKNVVLVEAYTKHSYVVDSLLSIYGHVK